MRKLIKTFNYGTVPNSYDLLKAVALITMIIDHLGYYVFPDNPWFRVVGRIAFPIFLFLVGYSQSYRFDKWLITGAVIVLVGQAFNGVPIMPLNILFGIAFWRVMMLWLEKRPHLLQDTLMLWVVMLVFYLPSMLLFEYGTLGLMFAVLGWHTRNGRDDMGIRVTWLFTLGIWIAIQAVTFKFPAVSLMLFIGETMVIGMAMSHFALREFPLPPKHSSTSPTILESAAILIARNTLILYVLHVVTLQIIGHILHPDKFGQLFKFYQFV